ncbi:MAG: hypothetical protein QM820_46040 [Minicystis sp.]
MRAHRGRVEVDSAPGCGSAFTLFLKRHQPLALLKPAKTDAAEHQGGVA